MACNYLNITINGGDIAAATGNSNTPPFLDGYVYVDYYDCNGNLQTLAFTSPGSYDYIYSYGTTYTAPKIYYYVGDSESLATFSSYSDGGPLPSPTPTPTPISCVGIIATEITPIPQSGPNNYFGVNVALTNWPVDESVTVSGTISTDTNTSDWVLVIGSGSQSAETSNTFIQGSPTSLSNITVTGVTPSSVTFETNTYNICGFEPSPTPSQTETPTQTPTYTETPTVTPSNTSTPQPTNTPSPTFNCTSCRNYQYSTVPTGGDVIYYYSCDSGSLQTFAVSEFDTGNFCNCNTVGTPYTDNGTLLTEVGACALPTPSVTPTLTQTPTATSFELFYTSTTCNTEFSSNAWAGSGGRGIYTITIDIGPATGLLTLNYDALSIPDQFQVFWNSTTVIDTGFVSDCYPSSCAAANSALNALGFPNVSGPNGSASFNKTLASPSIVTIVVTAPLQDTVWYAELVCLALDATPTPTPTETTTQTPTPSVTAFETPTPTPTITQTPSVTPPETPTQTPSQTLPETPTPTPTITQTPSVTPPETPTQTPSQTLPETPTQTPTQTLTQTPTQTFPPGCYQYTATGAGCDLDYWDCSGVNITIAGVTSLIFCADLSYGPITSDCTITLNGPCPTQTPTQTVTPTPTETPTNTPSETPTNTPTETVTPTQSETPTMTPTETPTNTPTVTVTPTQSETPTNTPTETVTPTQSETPTMTPTETPTETPTTTPTETPTNTPSETPTMTPTETTTPTETPTTTPSETPTNTPTTTMTPTQTTTTTETPTNTPTTTMTPTQTTTVSPTMGYIVQFVDCTNNTNIFRFNDPTIPATIGVTYYITGSDDFEGCATTVIGDGSGPIYDGVGVTFQMVAGGCGNSICPTISYKAAQLKNCRDNTLFYALVQEDTAFLNATYLYNGECYAFIEFSGPGGPNLGQPDFSDCAPCLLIPTQSPTPRNTPSQTPTVSATPPACPSSTFCFNSSLVSLITYNGIYSDTGSYNSRRYYVGNGMTTAYIYYTGNNWCLSTSLGGSCILKGSSPCYSQCPDISANDFTSGICPTPTPTPIDCYTFDFNAYFDCDWEPIPSPTPSIDCDDVNFNITYYGLTPTPSPTGVYCNTTGVLFTLSAYTASTPTVTVTPSITLTRTVDVAGQVKFLMLDETFTCTSVKVLKKCGTDNFLYTSDSLNFNGIQVVEGMTIFALINGEYMCVTYERDDFNLSSNSNVDAVYNILSSCDSCSTQPTPTPTVTSTATNTPTSTPNTTPTSTPTLTQTISQTPSQTPTTSTTPTYGTTPPPTPFNTQTQTPTPTYTPTNTPSTTPTRTLTPTPSPTPNWVYVFEDCNSVPGPKYSTGVQVIQTQPLHFTIQDGEVFKDSAGNCWIYVGRFESDYIPPYGMTPVTFTGNYFAAITSTTIFKDCTTCQVGGSSSGGGGGSTTYDCVNGVCRGVVGGGYNTLSECEQNCTGGGANPDQ